MPIATTQIAMEDQIMLAVNAAVRERIEVAVKAEVERAQKQISAMIPEIVAGVAIKLQSVMTMERFGTDLRIVIKLEDGRR